MQMEAGTAFYRKPRRMVVRRGEMEGWRTREVHRGTRGRSDGESLDIGIRRRGVDTSFDDVLGIAVPYATYGSSNNGCIWHTRASEPCSLFRYNGLYIIYVLSGAQQTFSRPANLV